MPLIEVHPIENVFNPEQKRQIIKKLTDAMVLIEGANMRDVTRSSPVREISRAIMPPVRDLRIEYGVTMT